MFQKSALPNDKCYYKFNILIYSQKSDLFTYFEKRRRVLHNGTVLSKQKVFSFQFDITFNLLFI